MKSVLAHEKVTVSKNERALVKRKKQSDDNCNEDDEDVPTRKVKVTTKLTLKTIVFAKFVP